MRGDGVGARGIQGDGAGRAAVAGPVAGEGGERRLRLDVVDAFERVEAVRGGAGGFGVGDEKALAVEDREAIDGGARRDLARLAGQASGVPEPDRAVGSG